MKLPSIIPDYSVTPDMPSRVDINCPPVIRNGYSVEKADSQKVLSYFEHSQKGMIKKAFADAFVTARKVSKAGVKPGAIFGVGLGIAGAITAAISFPSSLLASAITVATGVLKGTAVGAGIGFVLGGIYQLTKSSLYLALTTPKQRLIIAAKQGREELDKLDARFRKGDHLTTDEYDRYSQLNVDVALWEYAAVKLSDNQMLQNTGLEDASHSGKGATLMAV